MKRSPPALRALVQARELKKVQRKLGCARSSLGSLSESVAVFEPERLREIITKLGGQLEPSTNRKVRRTPPLTVACAQKRAIELVLRDQPTQLTLHAPDGPNGRVTLHSTCGA